MATVFEATNSTKHLRLAGEGAGVASGPHFGRNLATRLRTQSPSRRSSPGERYGFKESTTPQYKEFLINKDAENLNESDQPDDGFNLPEEPVARFCGDPNGPILLYADGRIEQKTIPTRPLDTDPKKLKLGESMREDGAGLADPIHHGNPGHVGG